MRQKNNLWNTPLRNPSPEQERYAKNLYEQRRKTRVPRGNEGDTTGVTEPAPQRAKNTPFPPSTEERNRPKKDSPAGSPKDDLGVDEQTPPSPEVVTKYRVLKRKQRRRQSLSVAVSEEEEELLRQGAAEAGMTFSAWARTVLFRAMKRKIPDRPPS